MVKKALDALNALFADVMVFSDEATLALEGISVLYFYSINLVPANTMDDLTACFCAELDAIRAGDIKPILRGLSKIVSQPFMQRFAERLAPYADGGEVSEVICDACWGQYFKFFKDMENGNIHRTEWDTWFTYFCGRCKHMNEVCMYGEVPQNEDA